MGVIDDLLLGAIVMASLVIALFFLRFWHSTKDRFFLFFALSFFIDAMDRLFLTPASPSTEDASEYYVVRLVAYSLILFAILDKNRPRNKGK
jgi:hypothetical protein